jgi:hypothetical protein
MPLAYPFEVVLVQDVQHRGGELVERRSVHDHERNDVVDAALSSLHQHDQSDVGASASGLLPAVVSINLVGL